MKRVLIIAAHPDDDILGCGGFISKYQSKGVQFKIIFVGEGSTCRYEDPFSDESLAAIKERTSSAKKAMLTLKIQDFEMHDLPCGRFDQVPIIDINKIIEKAIQDFDPDTLLTHSPYDVNNDHKIVFHSTMMATRPGALHFVEKIMSYEVLSSSEWSFINTFSPNYFEEIGEDDLVLKWEALSKYESEINCYPHPRSLEGVRSLAIIRGMQAGFKYAEAFHLIREFKR
jgi:LmbE family N-acetylglucosaminyl deacetylase